MPHKATQPTNDLIQQDPVIANPNVPEPTVPKQEPIPNEESNIGTPVLDESSLNLAQAILLMTNELCRCLYINLQNAYYLVHIAKATNGRPPFGPVMAPLNGLLCFSG